MLDAVYDLLTYFRSKNKIIAWLNLMSAFCALIAAMFWIFSGGLGEVTLVISDLDKIPPVAKGAARFNTIAAKWAFASAFFVILSSMITIFMKDDSVRQQEEEEEKARQDAHFEQMIADYHKEKAVTKKTTRWNLWYKILFVLLCFSACFINEKRKTPKDKS